MNKISLTLTIVLGLMFVILSSPSFRGGSSLKELTTEPLFRVAVLAVILYVTTQAFGIGLLLTLVFLVCVVIDGAPLEGYMNYGKPVADCDNYADQTPEYPQGAFYPLSA
jgi:hypothetical protein